MNVDSDINGKITELERRLSALDEERGQIARRLAELKKTQAACTAQAEPSSARITMNSSTAAKIALFRSLFRGRQDVFPQRWDNAKTGKSGYSPVCGNEWVRGVCGKPQVKCGECPSQAFKPVTDEIIRAHLQGRLGSGQAGFTAGVYPMLPDDTCWFLAADFDKQSWMNDVTAFRDAAHAEGVPIAVERSRSGNGAHAWIFFVEPVHAAEARRLGALLITAAMDRSPDIGFNSYDRFFPSQDTMPAGGFGNLIALPLQAKPRESGNSVFVDDNFLPFADQWAYLSSIRRMPAKDVAALVATASEQGRILRVRIPLTDNEDEPWAAPPSRRRSEPAIDGPLQNPSNSFLAIASILTARTFRRYWSAASSALPPFKIQSSMRRKPCVYLPSASRVSSPARSFSRNRWRCRGGASTTFAMNSAGLASRQR